MADIVNSLFGLSPQEMRAEKLAANRERSLGLAQLAPQGYGAIVAGAGDIGFALGEGLGSLFGMEDPALTKAKNIENVLFSVQNELGPDAVGDPTKLYPLLSQKLNEAGLSREATKVSLMGTDEIAKYRKNEAEIFKAFNSNQKAKQSKLNTLQKERDIVRQQLEQDPNNPLLQKELGEYDSAIDKEASRDMSLDKIAAKNITTVSNPNSTPEEITRANNELNSLAAIKLGPDYFYDPVSESFGLRKGGPKANERLANWKKGVDIAAQGLSKVDFVTDALDTALNLISPKSTGLVGKGAVILPETEAYQLQEAINVVIANIGFDRLQQMRDQSKTGGALGQVAVKELEMLQKVMASLDIGLDEETLRTNIIAVQEQYAKTLRAYNQYIKDYQDWIARGADPNENPDVDYDDTEYNKILEQSTQMLDKLDTTSLIKTTLEQKGYKYEPNKYDYAFTNGQLTARPKRK
jgi:hypothetical protein